jgi:3D (Asp-Asp-Asp) domain-containing protein
MAFARGDVPAPPPDNEWVVVQRDTGLWSGPNRRAERLGTAWAGARLQLAASLDGARLHVWDPTAENYAYVDSADVKTEAALAADKAAAERVKNLAAEEAVIEPPRRTVWSGTARVSMYTCVELGGCGRTASGVWPYEGVVAVDPRIIPLGSMVWLDGLGHFLAADTGSAIRGNRIDVFVTDYSRARSWGVQYLSAEAYYLN